MNIREIRFSGGIRDRKFSEMTINEFTNALRKCNWRLSHSQRPGYGDEFFKRIKERGPKLGVLTPADLQNAIMRGSSEGCSDGKTIHVTRRGAKIIYNSSTRTLISFVPNP